jgi:hypothetical protein
MARLLYFLTLVALALSAEAKVYGAMRVRLAFGLVGRQTCGEGNTCAEACATCGAGNVQCGATEGLNCNCYDPSAGEVCVMFILFFAIDCWSWRRKTRIS